ncbi:MAG: hypothetical protein H7A46_06985 [Verrucomicrobiales bacterium]|nr:hypothetical protein [Verrucomicrobiales bacterium]
MQSPVKHYQREIHDNTGFFATWLPNEPVEVGDIGRICEGRFRRSASLEDLGIAFEVAESRTEQALDYRSTNGTKVTTKESIDGKGIGTAEVEIDFSHEGAFLFQASGLRVKRLRDSMGVGAQVVKAYEEGRWEKSWLVIEALQRADVATIIVSQDVSAGLVLTAKMDEVLVDLSLADPRVNLSLKSQHGRMISFLSSKGPRPLYSCLRLARSWPFASPSVRPVRGQIASAADCPLCLVGVDELLAGTEAYEN